MFSNLSFNFLQKCMYLLYCGYSVVALKVLLFSHVFAPKRLFGFMFNEHDVASKTNNHIFCRNNCKFHLNIDNL